MNNKDLVNKLRSYNMTSGYTSTMRRAAEAIEALEVENQKLRNKADATARKMHKQIVDINQELKTLLK